MTSASVSAAQPPAPGVRTLFIIVDAGMAIRNILRTDIYKILKAQPNLRIVIFSPLTDPDFQAEVGGPNVVVEPLPTAEGGRLARLLRSVRKDLWSRKPGVETYRFRRAHKDRLALRNLALNLITPRLSPERMERWIAWLERKEIAAMPPMATELFDRYRPDLVFYTTLYSNIHCLEVGALQRRIKTVSFILSWDNPTTKGPFPIKPDRAIVWNEILKNELVRYHAFRPEQIYISGAPQFDLYATREGYRDRATWFRDMGLDPAKKLLTYTTGTPGTAPEDNLIVEQVYHAMIQGAFRQPCQLLVRLHPKDNIDLYQRFVGKPGLTLMTPGRRGKTDDRWNPTREDMYGLAECMWHTDVNINMASTISIDATAFDTPVVNVAFDATPDRPLRESVKRFYSFEHYSRIVASGGVRVAESLEQLIQHVQAYLDDPSLDAAGRRRITTEQCWKLDGQSGRRIADYVLACLNEA